MPNFKIFDIEDETGKSDILMLDMDKVIFAKIHPPRQGVLEVVMQELDRPILIKNYSLVDLLVLANRGER